MGVCCAALPPCDGGIDGDSGEMRVVLYVGQSIIVRAWPGRRGSGGGEEAPEAVGSTWCTLVSSLPISSHTPVPSPPPHSHSHFLSVQLSALHHRLYFLILLRAGGVGVASARERKRKGHRMIALLNRTPYISH